MNMKKILLCILLPVMVFLAGCAKAEIETGINPEINAGVSQEADANVPDYSISLEPEKIETFQSATSHLLYRIDKNRYFVQYRDCGAVLEDGKLTTLYDGMGVAIPGKTETIFPVLDHHGGLGDVVQCTGKVVLTLDEEKNGWRSLTQVDRQTETATLLGMSLLTESTDEDLLSGTYSQAPDVSQYNHISCFFSASPIYRMAFEQNGKPLPVDKLEVDENYLFGYSCEADADTELCYIPLQGDGYYLVYEITDTKGQVYCSDLIPYEAAEIPLEEDVRNVEYSVKWEKGTREQFLFSKNGLDIYLAVMKDMFYATNVYAVKARNNTDKTQYVYATDLIINGNVYSNSTCCIEVAPGKFVAEEFRVGIADGAPELEHLNSVLFAVEAGEEYFSGQTVMEKTFVQVDMTEAWYLDRQYADSFCMSQPAMDALAEEQQLFENENLRMTLVNAGAASEDDKTLRLVIKAENLTPYTQSVAVHGVEVNGIHLGKSRRETIPGHCTAYMYVDIGGYEMGFMHTPSVQTLQVVFQLPPEEPWDDPVKVHSPVKLVLSGTAENPAQGELLWETENAQIRLLRYDAEKYKWWLSLQNTSDQTLALDAQDVITGEDVFFTHTTEPGETTVVSITNPNDGLLVTEDAPYAILMQLYETENGALYAELTDPVTLHTVKSQ